MYARYGSYQHPDNEVNITRISGRPRYSPRMRKLTTVITMDLEGELLETTQAAIDAKISQLETAYSQDGFNFGFFTDDNVLTNHKLMSTDANCVCPVRVLNRSFPVGDPAEFATKRTFHITLQAEFLTPESQLVSWDESIEYVGNAGERFEVVETYDGPQAQRVNNKTSQRIIQSGSAVALQATFLPPGPLLTNIEHKHVRRVKLNSGKVMGRLALFYQTEWTYTMTSDRYREVFPVTR